MSNQNLDRDVNNEKLFKKSTKNVTTPGLIQLVFRRSDRSTNLTARVEAITNWGRSTAISNFMLLRKADKSSRLGNDGNEPTRTEISKFYSEDLLEGLPLKSKINSETSQVCVSVRMEFRWTSHPSDVRWCSTSYKQTGDHFFSLLRLVWKTTNFFFSVSSFFILFTLTHTSPREAPEMGFHS